jgi:hypothetical protein
MTVGFFKGINSEGRLAWRVDDSLTFGQFFQTGLDERTPDHAAIIADAPADQRSRALASVRVGAEASDVERLIKGKAIGSDYDAGSQRGHEVHREVGTRRES